MCINMYNTISKKVNQKLNFLGVSRVIMRVGRIKEEAMEQLRNEFEVESVGRGRYAFKKIGGGNCEN